MVVVSAAKVMLKAIPRPELVDKAIGKVDGAVNYAASWIAYVFLLHALIKDVICAMRWSALCKSAVDHLWMAVGLALRPFHRTPGFFERRCVARAMHLDPPPHRIEVRHIATAAVNGGKDVLRATLWLPKDQPGPFPTLIQRSPYGAQSTMSEWGQMLLAERGYAVLFQDTRGRFGSDGDFVPVEHERADGAATVRWAREQPWCDGRIGVIGASYLGFAAWAAIGACEPGELQCAVPTITQAVVRPAVFSSAGAIALELLVLWFYLIELIALKGPFAFVRAVYRDLNTKRLSRAFMHAPLETLDRLLVGKEWEFFQGGVREPHNDDAPFWRERSTLCELRPERAGCVAPPPIHIVTGLHDFFAPQTLVDFERAARLQPHTRLTMAPWSHWDFVSLAGWQMITHSTLHWLYEHMPILDDADLLTSPRSRPRPGPWETWTVGRTEEDLSRPVQVCFLGSMRWRGFRAWPPPDTHALRLWLTHGGGLDPRAPRPRRPLDPPPAETALRYTYRPSDPTPAAGGPSFNPLNAGTWTQRAVEQREDVLCFTGEPFAAPLALGGAAVLRVRLWSASRSVDVVARLCRVDLRGASFNLCEGLTRVDAEATELSIGTAASSAASSSAASSAAAAPDAAGRLVSVTMSPLAVELSPGERLRLHVCSAAHPRWMRNLCADPDVPLHEQRPPSECFACVVRIGVDEAECCLELPVVDDDGA